MPTTPKRQGLLDSQWTYLLIIPVVVVVWLVIANSRQNSQIADLPPEVATLSESPLGDDDMPAFADAIAKVWAGEAVDRKRLPTRLGEQGQPVYVAFRSKGKRLYHLWRHPTDVPAGGTMWDVLLQAIEDGRRGLGDDLAKVDRLEIALSHTYRKYDYKDKEQRKLLLDEDPHKIPHHMGVRGLAVEHGDKQRFMSPTWFVASNRRVRKQLEQIRKDWKLDEDEFATASFSTFEADQLLVRLDKLPVEAVVMFRGNRVVDISEVDQASTEKLARGMIDWLTNNTDSSGRLVYHYYPASGRESSGNNMIRQWMATNAMVRWAHDRNDQAVFDVAEKNIDYNIEHFFHFERDRKRVELEEGEPVPPELLGVIEYSRKTKLGGVALAGMAMWLHPKRDKWAQEIAGLQNMVDHLWHEDGSFTSFYKGSDKEYFNFYPGEAMLWWATIYAETKDPELLAKFKKSFEYYRKWHLEPKNRNPAFVPWHLQADYAMWQALGEDEAEFKKDLEEFMFETATWLVDNMQQWDEGEWVYPDEKGQFYAVDKRWGIPHASSTGVYLEGLIDAWQLARDLGEDDKREFYRIAMLRGIRSMMQLQFVDDVDMFYVSKTKAVEGGIRTNVFDSAIRCDNVQHPLMGIIKILRMFEANEYSGAQ
ncbi:MAG: hypothetical protein R6X02_10755 [Enhygromyxa sp.]